MKDKNGIEFQVGDVCVVHVIDDVLNDIDESWHGTLCIVSELYKFRKFPVFSTIGEKGGDVWEFCATELEIIGDVR